MNKYTLANNKIYETKNLIKVLDDRYPNGYMTKEGIALIATKQADTLSELCDEFVIDDRPDTKPFIISAESSDELNGNILYAVESGYGVYGAIWVETNLICVAKVNKDGSYSLLR